MWIIIRGRRHKEQTVSNNFTYSIKPLVVVLHVTNIISMILTNIVAWHPISMSTYACTCICVLHHVRGFFLVHSSVSSAKFTAAKSCYIKVKSIHSCTETTCWNTAGDEKNTEPFPCPQRVLNVFNDTKCYASIPDACKPPTCKWYNWWKGSLRNNAEQ